MRGFVTLLCLVIGLTASSSPSFAAQAKPPQTIDELRARIATVLARNGVAGAGLALVRHDRLVWSGGVGFADRASKQPVTSETLFRVGSITKSFVALALLKLAEQGRIDLKARVADLAPELAIANRWQRESPITVAHLLEHTAGFDDMHFNETYAPLTVENMPLAEILARNPRSRVARWRPGSRFSYANPGYTVAAYLIEKASGRPWTDYVRDELLLPLGMRSAALRWSPEVDARLARGYGEGPDALPYRAIYHFPAGNLMASPRELAALVQLELARGRAGGRQLVTAASMGRMERSETNAVRGLDSDYGLGNYGETWQKVRLRGHSGGIDGFISGAYYAPAEDFGFVVLLNSTGRHVFEAMMETRALIIDYLLAGRTPAPPPPAVRVDERTLAPWVGDYRLANPRHQLFAFLERLLPGVRLQLVGGRLQLVERGGKRRTMELLPLGDGRFRMPTFSGSHIAFTHDEAGRPVLVDGGFYLVAEPSWIGPALAYGSRAVLWLLVSVLALPLAALLFARRSAAIGAGAPLMTLVSFVATPWLFLAAAQQNALGERNALTIGVCVGTIGFALSSLVTLWQALRGLGQPLPIVLKLHRVLIGLAATATTIFFAYYGVIGVRTWSY